MTSRLVRVLETLRIAPKGSTAVSDFLNAGAKALVQGGETGVFTPMFFFHVRKPACRPRRDLRRVVTKFGANGASPTYNRARGRWATTWTHRRARA